ncbi:ROK family protein [Telluribacter sp.]|jgi:glucokinase|uniref:ROK family protein n=1 Tax=Telluribacter sp. TaxID=1978767 RepID=UPI002E0EE001|nr:ROK family protein [Telluribacter sp.]
MQELAIGVDIGGTRTKIGLVDLRAGRVLETLIFSTETRDASRFEHILSDAIYTLQNRPESADATLKGVGIGVSGFVFEDATVDSTYGFIDFMEDYPLAGIVEKAHHLPCRLDNDARLVALGEALYGSGRGFHRVLVLTLGTGLGLGLVVNGRLAEKLPYGHMGGHMTVTHNDSRCYCGKTGCLESLVSATGLLDSARRYYGSAKQTVPPASVEALFRAAAEKNETSCQVVHEFLGHLSTGLGNYINLFAPDRIVLGGGMAKGLDPWLPTLLPTRQLGPYKKYQTTLSLSTLAEQAGILGGAALFR